MGYDKTDELTINTIRVLAVSSSLLSPVLGLGVPRPARDKSC